MGYLLIYANTLFNVDDDHLTMFKKEDATILQEVQKCGSHVFHVLSIIYFQAKRFYELLYNRLAKHKLGWKKGSFTKMEIARFLQEIKETNNIYQRNNLSFSNDDTNTEWIMILVNR